MTNKIPNSNSCAACDHDRKKNTLDNVQFLLILTVKLISFFCSESNEIKIPFRFLPLLNSNFLVDLLLQTLQLALQQSVESKSLRTPVVALCLQFRQESARLRRRRLMLVRRGRRRGFDDDDATTPSRDEGREEDPRRDDEERGERGLGRQTSSTVVRTTRVVSK